MSTHWIERQFERIGARASVHAGAGRRASTGVSIDIGRDAEGEYFDIAVAPGRASDLSVLDCQPRLRHLVLMSRQSELKHKFLCGHDERHWFVAAVPERESVSTVQSAFTALKPVAIRQLEDRLKVKPRKRNRRRNEAFIRQGEWFFVPVPAEMRVDERLVFRNEPLQRGGGKPHLCEELVREGGELVYVSSRYPNGLLSPQYQKVISRKPELRNLHWAAQRRNPNVLVRGKVRHPDHKAIVLIGWHRVLMNTETQSLAMRHVAFID